MYEESTERLFSATTRTFEKSDVYRNYPTVRLTGADVTTQPDGTLILPDGEWTRKNIDLPTPSQTEAFRESGYDIDSDGRPLHPWVREMLADPNIGVVTGRGFYRKWGPNYTADPVVLTREKRTSVLLIQRMDTGVWALPGGFVDEGETDPYDSATRELYEETNLDIPVSGEMIYQGPVADIRTTAHSWADTSAYSFVVDEPLPVLVRDPKEVKAVQWFYIDELPEELHGSHAVLIQLAVERLKNPPRPTIREVLNKPTDQLEKTIVDAGHMAYDHFFIRDGNDRLFIKAHDASRFTDDFREAHSRSYLQKEFDFFTRLADEGYAAIPDRVDLVDDSLLAMDALYEGDGWQWRAPEGEQFNQYVTDVLTAFDTLQAIPIPDKPFYHDAIEPTYPTFWKEGWDDITDEKVETLTNKILELSSEWNDEQQKFARDLIKDLPALRERAQRVNRDPELFLAHNDARQSNIAWRAGDGAKLVDWSWGDPAPKDSDATMFLIDLVKSGRDVTPFASYINKDQLIVQIGFLLGHSLWNTRDGSTTVREQQIASATAAHRLLELL